MAKYLWGSNSFWVHPLLHNLHTPLLKFEDPLMSWNVQQIYPVIKDDNWCQSWLDFLDLNPVDIWHEPDDII